MSTDGALETGQQVGPYVIGERIGRGGFGEVWQARHEAIARDVAIKVLHAKYSRDAAAVARFVAEAKAANTIDHPNIVQVFDFGELADGRCYFVMELLRGQTLRQLLAERGSLPIAEAMPILRGIAQAIDAAHAVQLAHRDLKPDNVFVLSDGRVKVIDFGLVKLVGDASEALTETGAIAGTPLYMSPEQFRGREIGLPSDAYSFGALAYHVLVGQPPFSEKDPIALGLRHLNDAPAAPGLGDDIDRWILALLEKDPARRPRSLVAAIEHLPERSRPRALRRVAGSVLVVAALGIGYLALRDPVRAAEAVPLQLQIRTSSLVSRGPLSAEQRAAIEQAAPRMMRQALRDAQDRKFGFSPEGTGGDATIEIALELRGATVQLRAWRGPALLAETTAASVRDAVTAAVPSVNAALSAHLPPAVPDEIERAGMAAVHAPSLAAYRHYQRIVDHFDRSWWVSNEAIIAELEGLIAAEPAWSRPYALSCIAAGTQRCAAQIAAEAAHANPAIDPTGHRLMILFRDHHAASLDELEKLADLRLDPEPAMLLEHAYDAANHSDDSIALLRELYRARPDLQYAQNLAYALRLAGRTAEADELALEWARTHPEADQALSSQALLFARRGDLEAATSALELRKILLGENAEAWPALVDIYIELGDLATARRFIDRLLADTPQHRALARVREGTIDVLEGRFSVAYDTFERAEAENKPYGLMSQSMQVIASMISLAPYVRPGELRAKLAELDAWASSDAGIHGDVAYELALLDRKPGERCPAREPFVQHVIDERRILRLAASHDCATCAEAVAAGLSESELSPRSLLAFGRCAEQTHRLGLAREAYERARRWTDSNQGSAFESMRATAHLADVLEQLGDRDAARRYATVVIERWGNADHALPETELARQVLAR